LTVRSVIRRLAETAIHLGLVIGAGAVAMIALASALNANASNTWRYGLLVGTATAALYSFHRLVSLKRRTAGERTGRFAALGRDAGLIRLAVLAWTASTVAIAAFVLDPVLFACMLPAIVLSLAYVMPVTRSGRRLRDLGGVKILWIALAWAWLTAFIPSYVLSGLALLNSSVQFLERFFFIAALCLPFDVRDRSSDREAGLPNLTATLSEKQVRRLGRWLMGLAVFFAAFNGVHYFNTAYALVPVLLFIPYDRLLKASFTRSNDLLYSGLGDGFLVIAWLLFFALKYAHLLTAALISGQ
jgi:hypothetical protein